MTSLHKIVQPCPGYTILPFSGPSALLGRLTRLPFLFPSVPWAPVLLFARCYPTDQLKLQVNEVPDTGGDAAATTFHGFVRNCYQQ